MERYQISNGIIINLLEENIVIRKNMERIIIQYKIFYNIIMSKCQMNGNMKLLMKMTILKL